MLFECDNFKSCTLSVNIMGIEKFNLMVFLVFIVAVLFCLIVFALARFITKKNIQRRYDFVLENSRKIPKVLELNEQYTLCPLSSRYTFEKYCDSKGQYERCLMEDCLLEVVKENILLFKDLVNKAVSNRESLLSYDESFESIMNTDTDDDKALYSRYTYFKTIEDELCLKRKLTPISDLFIIIELKYTSPKGKNSYSSNYSYYTDDIIECFGKIESEVEYQNSVKYQRDLMSAKLRYKVMQRDGFKCQICGRTQKDNVKLHVDHIFPVSKGGLTEMSNLRTLWEECNLGKGADYDPYGLN